MHRAILKNNQIITYNRRKSILMQIRAEFEIRANRPSYQKLAMIMLNDKEQEPSYC